MLIIDKENDFSYSYPSAGGIYEQELYIIINNLKGLEAGLYHYIIGKNALSMLSNNKSDIDTVYKEFNSSHCFKINKTQILILISANRDLMCEKYGELSLGLALRNCGCLIEAIYLIAAELKIGICALGKNRRFSYETVFSGINIKNPIISEMVLGEMES